MHQVIEFYEQNLRLSRETGDHRGEMAALSSLGNAYDALDKHEKAVECYEQALEIARRIGDARGERLTLGKLNEALKPASPDNADRPPSPAKKSGRSKPAKAKSIRNKIPRQRRSKSTRPSKKPRQTKGR